MTNRQIHELDSVTALSGSDRLLVSTASGNLTRRSTIDALPFTQKHAGAAARTMAGKLEESVSVKDFGAVGDGVADDSPAFQAAVNASKHVFVPAGTYRLASKVDVKPQREIRGAGRGATTIVAQAALAFEFHRNSKQYNPEPGHWYEVLADWTVEPSGSYDWCRSSLSHLAIQMSRGGIQVHGHEFYGHHLSFYGGTAGAWAIRMHAANECSLDHISGGYGGGPFAMAASGIEWYALDIPAQDAADLQANGPRHPGEQNINYGDSTIHEVSFKGSVVGWQGLRICHYSTSRSIGVHNNLHVNRCQFQAPTSSGAANGITTTTNPNATAQDIAGAVWATQNSTGMFLHRVQRSVFTLCDMEATHYAIQMTGGIGTGALGGAASKYNTFIGCQSFNAAVPWRDSNADTQDIFGNLPLTAAQTGTGFPETLEGSVGRNGFYAGQQTGPMQPRGDASDRVDLKGGQADFIFPQAAWFTSANYGTPVVNIRGAQGGTGFSDQQLIITSPGRDTGRIPNSPGTGADGIGLDDAHPKQNHPTRGFRLYTGGLNEAVLARPIGQKQRADARLEIGNGPDETTTVGANGPLKSVTIRDPLHLLPWSTQPVGPYNGSLFYAAAREALPSVTDWRGEGIYWRYDDREEGATVASPLWLPAITKPGIDSARELNASATLTRQDIGRILMCNHGSTTIVLTIPSTIITVAEGGTGSWVDAAGNQMREVATFWVYRMGNARVTFAAGTGTTVTAQDSVNEVPATGGFSRILLRRTSTTTAAAYITHFGAQYPTGHRKWASKSANYTLVASDLDGVIQFSSNSAGQVLTINSASLPSGPQGGRVTICQAGSVGVTLSTTLTNPGNVTTLTSAVGQVRTIHLSTSAVFVQ